ncbi:MAG: metallophosphoesterase [Planctomycetota bacterium]
MSRKRDLQWARFIKRLQRENPWVKYGKLAGLLFLSFLFALGVFIEPHWIRVPTVILSHDIDRIRIAHISDIHYRKGDRIYLKKVVKQLNDLDVAAVFFTGGIAERREVLEEALSILKDIRHPLYGVPGEGDPLDKYFYEKIRKTFESTGGAWLKEESVFAVDGKVVVVGAFGKALLPPARESGVKCVLLSHGPDIVEHFTNWTNVYDLILAGHTLGGQIRLPFFGPLLLPAGMEAWQMGLYHTAPGPLYVNPGIGTIVVPVRLFCRPEITVIEF